jgi:hypothetical protein
MPRDERRDTLSGGKGKQETKSDYLDFRARMRASTDLSRMQNQETGNWTCGGGWIGWDCNAAVPYFCFFVFFFFFFFGECVSRLPCLLLWYYITKTRCATEFARGTVQWYCTLCMGGGVHVYVVWFHPYLCSLAFRVPPVIEWHDIWAEGEETGMHSKAERRRL